jgi:hypothetical protein
MTAQSVYLALIGESVGRLNAALGFELEYRRNRDLPTLDASVLQLRKALELIAIAAIAPDKKAYAEFRATADKDPDFTRDYHAAKIFHALSCINPDFYPRALLPPSRQLDGTWHFETKTAGVPTKKQFERSYDRLGKYLHAQNPWGKGQNVQNIASDMRGMIASAKELIAYHARFIRSPDFQGVWIVEAATPKPSVLNAEAKGPYAVGAA